MRCPRDDRGAAMLFALIALAILVLLAGTLTAVVLRNATANRTARSRSELLNRAESGVELAISKLAGDPSWRGARSRNVPGGPCDVAVKPAGDARYKITSQAAAQGSRPQWTCELHVRVQKLASGRFQLTDWKEAWR